MVFDAAGQQRIITDVNSKLSKSLLSNRNLIPAQCDFNYFYRVLTLIYNPSILAKTALHRTVANLPLRA